MNSIVELVPLLREQKNIIQNAPPDSKEVFGRIATQYLQHFRNVASDEMAFVDRTRQCMHQNDPYDMSTAPEPYLTVVMPVAIHREVPEELNKSLQAIAEVDHMEASEVILYGNRPEDTEPSMDLGALVRRAREWFPGHLRYTTTSYKEPDINLVRRDGNDLVVMDGLKRGYPPDHPLLWLDADVKSISKNYAKDIAERVRIQNGKGSIWRPCVRADSRHSFNGLNGEGVDDAVVLAALNELTVRAGVRKNRFAVGWMYPDEAAMAMALGTAALRWGQTREGQRMNPAESMRLIGIVALQRELLEDIAQKLAPQCTVRVPEKTARSPSGITSELFVPIATPKQNDAFPGMLSG